MKKVRIKKLNGLRKKAYKYFNFCKIVPDLDDILNYVIDCLVDERGQRLGSDEIHSIEEYFHNNFL